MRRSGIVQHTRDLGRHDHVCWSYDDPADVGLRVAEFLLDGLERGQRVRYVGSGDAQALVDAVRSVDRIAVALADGAAEVASLDARGPVIDPEGQVRSYATATEQALAAGYRGFRVAAEATALVRSQDQLTAFLHYEHLVDQYMADHPFSALCAYDRTRVGERALEQLASVHPSTNLPGAGFRLHASARPGHSAALSGEVDMFNRDVLVQVLDRIRPPARGGQLVLDAAGLTFIDHRGLIGLDRYARGRDTTLVLRTAFPGASRIANLLDLHAVRVEPVA
ncbi:STAS domain-containing protein [Saccharothrix saharensis]|uniref:STAS domain-containing protein n=1 Tax=Saccharothrix saharensis TaxID=571190 RepID=A0A543J6A3_9PSEU|nr:MEDS domain-containing protein [Saccharothrix saharensis]TQM78370.1 STAS domain-containing protein [Saccharothrix saharensis]